MFLLADAPVSVLVGDDACGGDNVGAWYTLVGLSRSCRGRILIPSRCHWKPMMIASGLWRQRKRLENRRWMIGKRLMFARRGCSMDTFKRHICSIVSDFGFWAVHTVTIVFDGVSLLMPPYRKAFQSSWKRRFFSDPEEWSTNGNASKHLCYKDHPACHLCIRSFGRSTGSFQSRDPKVQARFRNFS